MSFRITSLACLLAAMSATSSAFIDAIVGPLVCAAEPPSPLPHSSDR